MQLLLWHMTETAGGSSPDARLFTQKETGFKSSKSSYWASEVDDTVFFYRVIHQKILVESVRHVRVKEWQAGTYTGCGSCPKDQAGCNNRSGGKELQKLSVKPREGGVD